MKGALRTTETRPSQRHPRRKPAPELRDAAPSVPDPAAVVELARTAPRRPLPFREAMTARFGVPLGAVEVRVGPAARDACHLLGARAFAVRNVLAFRDESPSESLVAHEVAHVVQQGAAGEGIASRFTPGSLRVSVPGGRPEREASRAAHENVAVTLDAAPVAVYRDEAESAALLERHKILIRDAR